MRHENIQFSLYLAVDKTPYYCFKKITETHFITDFQCASLSEESTQTAMLRKKCKGEYLCLEKQSEVKLEV
jgi:hypothetical protein